MDPTRIWKLEVKQLGFVLLVDFFYGFYPGIHHHEKPPFEEFVRVDGKERWLQIFLMFLPYLWKWSNLTA